jgi:hypothetical protein
MLLCRRIFQCVRYTRPIRAVGPRSQVVRGSRGRPAVQDSWRKLGTDGTCSAGRQRMSASMHRLGVAWHLGARLWACQCSTISCHLDVSCSLAIRYATRSAVSGFALCAIALLQIAIVLCGPIANCRLASPGVVPPSNPFFAAHRPGCTVHSAFRRLAARSRRPLLLDGCRAKLPEFEHEASYGTLSPEHFEE